MRLATTAFMSCCVSTRPSGHVPATATPKWRVAVRRVPYYRLRTANAGAGPPVPAALKSLGPGHSQPSCRTRSAGPRCRTFGAGLANPDAGHDRSRRSGSMLRPEAASLPYHVIAVEPERLLQHELRHVPAEFVRWLLGQIQHPPVGDNSRVLQALKARFDCELQVT